MSAPTSAPIDYDALWKRAKSTLDSLAALRISRSQIKVVLGVIVVGGFAEVEQAILRASRFSNSGPLVAVKKLRPTGDRHQRIRVAAALARELHVWGNLNHPNILPLQGFHFDQSSLQSAWIVARWQARGNVATYLATTRPDEAQRLHLALGTARGLAYLHGLSPPVCHGDIKPENTLVDDTGNALLCDFGVASVLADVPSGLATIKTMKCTPRYASPELIKGEVACHTLASEVWAWGCVTLVITTDELPYGTKPLELFIIHSISAGELPVNLSNLRIPSTIVDLLDTCWKQDVMERTSILNCIETLGAAACSTQLSTAPSLPIALNTSAAGERTAQPRASLKELRLSDPMLDAALASLEPFRIPHDRVEATEFFAQGGHSIIWLGTLRNGSGTSKQVAVKAIVADSSDPQRNQFVKKVVCELKVWAGLNHPNVLPLLGFCLDEELRRAWFLSPPQFNGSAHSWLSDVDEALKLRWVADVAEAVAYLHGLDPPVIHGDIRVLNVLITASEEAMLCDFGLSKTYGEAPSIRMGWPPARYLSPELIHELEPSLEGDIWAWGCLAAEIMTGQQPYSPSTLDMAVFTRVLLGEKPAAIPCPEIPTKLGECILNCWEVEPEARRPVFEHIPVIRSLIDDSGGSLPSIVQSP